MVLPLWVTFCDLPSVYLKKRLALGTHGSLNTSAKSSPAASKVRMIRGISKFIFHNTTKAINTIPKEVCETSLPKYGGFNATSCTSNSYYRYKECFDDTTSLNTIIAKYQLNDNTYEVNNINFREGQSIIDEINTYRIMASFKNSNCILNFISSFDNKSVIIELFSMERESENSAILNN